jgi:hypothetical protein
MPGASARAPKIKSPALPHLDVALGGPDARVAVRGGLVVGTGHVEGHAVVKDHPVAVLRAHGGHRGAVDALQVLAGGGAGLHRGKHVGDEVARAFQPRCHLGLVLQRRAAAGHQLQGLERRQVVQRLRPVGEVGVAGVGRGVELDQVAGEQDALLRQPDHRVALGVAAAELQQLHFQLAQPQRHLAGEGEGRPGQPGRHALDVAEQTREAADLAGLVLLATLLDHRQRVLAGDDVLGGIGARAEHPHRVVVAEHHVLDRLVGHLADAADDVLRHHRGGLGVDDHHRVVADHDAGVGVALGGVGVGVVGQLREADLLLFEVGLGSEGFGRGAHGRAPGAAPREIVDAEMMA